MHLGAASMIGATGSNGSDNGVPEDFDALTFTNDDLYEVSSIGYTVHNLVINDPKKISNDDIKRIKDNFEKNNIILDPHRLRIQSAKTKQVLCFRGSVCSVLCLASMVENPC